VEADERALIAAVVAAVAVLGSTRFSRAATVAVIACVVAAAILFFNAELVWLVLRS